MSRRLLAVLVATVVVLPSACVPPSAPAVLVPRPASAGLRVMTYNVLGAQADDRVFDELGGIAARIDQLRPDVVVLQEAQADEVLAVTARTDGYRLAAYLQWVCDAKPSREGVAIVVRSATVSVAGAGGTHVGSSCVDPSVQRVLVWADLNLDSGPLRVYGTHLTAGGGTATQSRTNQIREIRRIIADNDPAGTGRWLFVGDMNTAPGEAAYRLILDGGSPGSVPVMVDTVAEAHPGADDPRVCPSVGAADAAGIARLLADPGLVAACGYTAGWPKDENLLGCDLLSLCTSWEQRRDLPVRNRIDDVFRMAAGPVTTIDSFVPNRTDPDWASPGAEWFRLSDHLPTVVDVAVAPASATAAAS